MFKETPTGPYSKWVYNEETEKFHPKRNWRSYFEQQMMRFFELTHCNFKIQTKFTEKTKKKLCLCLFDGFYRNCNIVFEATVFFFDFWQCQEEKRILFGIWKKDWRDENVKRREYAQGLFIILKRSGIVNGRNEGPKTQMGLRISSIHVVPSKHQFPETLSLIK